MGNGRKTGNPACFEVKQSDEEKNSGLSIWFHYQYDTVGRMPLGNDYVLLDMETMLLKYIWIEGTLLSDRGTFRLGE
jgi:hypothetical protein